MNNYHIYQQQAKGKYSVIFKARKKKKLEFVAIKRLQKTRKQKVYNEARILSTLSHPNIIKFYDFMQTKNHMWQISQYCPGGDLLKLIQYDKVLPQITVRGFIIQIMNGMIYAHSKGIIICDIKPATILINQYGNVKIGDFGSAYNLDDLKGNSKLKKKGTPSYMAPELLQIGGVYSFQSDLWALGCMMYELAQGNPPFVSTNFNQIVQLANKAPTPKVQNFSSDFNHLLIRLLQKNPSKRILWPQILKHPWVRNEIQQPQLQLPIQLHFLQYQKQRNKSKVQKQKLRISTNFQNYKNQNLINNRRQQIQFQNDQSSMQEYLQQKNKLDNQIDDISSIVGKIPHVIEYNMLKNKNKNNEQKLNQKQTNNNKKNKFQDSTNINRFMQTPTNKPNISLQQAINHQSDTAVKPIIGNKDIQLIDSFNFNKKSLGFNYIQPQVLAQGILNGQMENQLTKILQGMKGQQKINVLGYFQTLLQNSQVANYLFKSQFVPYYMNLVKSYKQSSLRAKICQILGLLIRHATSIDSEILKYGIIPGFIQAITKDKNQKVRRKAMAALGQLLFYGATQVDQDALEWDISLSLISTLLKILKNNNQDQIVRIYCCKTIQNITAQSQKVGLNFSQIDTLIVMINCFNNTKNQGFRTSIMCSIHHMITLNSTLRQIFLQKTAISTLIQTLQDPEVSSKTIQIILWILLQQFLKNLKSKYSKQLLQSKQLIKTMIILLQNSSSIVKGRVYLYIYYVLQYDFRKISSFVDSKLFTIIQRQGKQSIKYQSQCLQFLLSYLFQNFDKLLKYTTEQLQNILAQKSNNKLIIFDRNNYLLIINQMQSCAVFQQIFSNFVNIQLLINYLNLIQTQLQTKYIENFKNNYFIIIQKIFNNHIITQKLQAEYSNIVVPFFIGKIIKSTRHDIRFSCIKSLLSITNFLLSQQLIYDSTILTTTNNIIYSLIADHLIPQIDYLFSKKEQILNSMIFKLMSELFKAKDSQIFIKKYLKSCDINYILEYFNKNSTTSILKTVLKIFKTKERLIQIDKDKVNQFYEKCLIILQYFLKQRNQLVYQYPLQILLNIIDKYQINLQKKYVDRIFQNVIKLQSHSDFLIRQNSQKIIQILLNKGLYSEKCLNNWKNLNKKGQQNYQKLTKLLSLKNNQQQIKDNQQQIKNNQPQTKINQSRYS